MKRLLATLTVLTALLFLSVAPVSADDGNMGQIPPPAPHTNCNIVGWFSQVIQDSPKWAHFHYEFTWNCDDGEALTELDGEQFPRADPAGSVDRHCRSHVVETKQVRPHRYRYVTRLITDCDDASRAKVLHKSRWHRR